MTLKDLQDDVYALGFESVTDPDTLFISAVNRALSIIYAEQRYKKTVRLRSESIDVSSHIPKLRHKASDITLPLAGRAYSMRVSGRGCFTIRDGESEKTEEFDTEDGLYRGFILGECTLTLSGDYSYTVYDLTTYKETVSDSVESIPDGSGTVKYDFSEYADFLSFSGFPKDRLGRDAKYASVEGSMVTLRADGASDVFVTYNVKPKKVSADNIYTAIDIPASAEVPLSLLCASFLWRDDEPELAEYYFTMAKELMSKERSGFTSRNEKYTVSDGWA